MSLNNDNITSICIKKIPHQDFNNKEIRKIAARYGVVEMKEVPEFLFLNYSKITDLNACMEFFRHNGFTVEESRRNRSQSQQELDKRSSSRSNSCNANDNLNSLRTGTVTAKQNGNATQAKKNEKNTNAPNSNFSISKCAAGNCVLCQRQTALFCQRCNDFYCSVECQLKDWHNHRYICFPIPKLIDVSQLQTQLQSDIQPLIQPYQMVPQQGQPLFMQNHFIPPYPGYVPQLFPQKPNVTLPNVMKKQVQQINNIPLQSKENSVPNQQSQNRMNNPNQSHLKHNLNQGKQKPPPASSTPLNNYNPNNKGSMNNIANNQKPPLSDQAAVTNGNSKPLKPVPFSPPSKSKPIKKPTVTNSSLTNKTSETEERLKHLLLHSKNTKDEEQKSDEDEDEDSNEEAEEVDGVDAATLAYLKTVAEQNKIERACKLSNHSSSLKSVCPNIPSYLQGTAKFPDNRSFCVIVGKDLIRSSVFIRSTSPPASKEFNEIIQLVIERGPEAPELQSRPKLGDQVLGLHKGFYCRALVVNFISIDEIYLFFIDTGEQDYLKLGELRSLPPEFKKLKKYIFNVKLRNCSGNFGLKAQYYIEDLIERSVQVRLEYNGVGSSSANANDVVCDLYNHSTNEHINDHLRLLQEQDDS